MKTLKNDEFLGCSPILEDTEHFSGIIQTNSFKETTELLLNFCSEELPIPLSRDGKKRKFFVFSTLFLTLSPLLVIEKHNFVSNPDMTINANGWEFFDQGFRHSPIGRNFQYAYENLNGGSIMINSPDRLATYGASQTVFINQTEPQSIFISAWSKAENVEGAPDEGYAVVIDFHHFHGV
jgi:hypothetical protein